MYMLWSTWTISFVVARSSSICPIFCLRRVHTTASYLLMIQCASFFSSDVYYHFDLPSAQPLDFIVMSLFSFKKLGKISFFILPVSCSSCSAFLVCSCFSALNIASVSFSLNYFMPWLHISLCLNYTRVYLRILYCELPKSCSSVRFTLFSGHGLRMYCVFFSLCHALYILSLLQ